MQSSYAIVGKTLIHIFLRCDTMEWGDDDERR